MKPILVLIATIWLVSGPASRCFCGPVQPFHVKATIAAQGRDRYRVALKGNEVAAAYFYIAQIGYGTFELSVTGPNGAVVGSDKGNMLHSPMVSWTPTEPGVYLIELTNNDRLSYNYELTVYTPASPGAGPPG